MSKPKITITDIKNISFDEDVESDEENVENTKDDSDDDESEESEIEEINVVDLIKLTLKTLSKEQANSAGILITELKNPMVQYEAFNLLVQNVIDIRNTPEIAISNFKADMKIFGTDYMKYSTQDTMKASLNKKLFAYEYENDAIEGVTCPSCKSTSTIARRVQTAGSDESTAFLLRCTRCNYSGKTM